MALAEAQRLVDRALGSWIDRGRAVGVVAGLIRGDELAVKAFGSSGTARPLGPDSLMEIGSITKTFTGLLLAEMSLRGEVGLEDPVAGHVPFDLPADVTLLDLAMHTSGLPRSGRILIRQSFRNRREPFVAFTEDDLRATAAAARIRRARGTKMRYSNIGFGLLGNILSRVGGRPYGDLLTDRISRPLGLVDTGAEVDEGRLERLARGHRRGGRPAPPFRIPALAGAGVLRSTAVDMLTYLRAHLSPERTPLAEALRLALGPHRTFKGGKVAVGLAWLHVRRGDPTFVWHNGGTVGFGSFAALDPARDAGVVLLSNSRYLLRSGRLGVGLLRALGS